jgi:hypothetical protein
VARVERYLPAPDSSFWIASDTGKYHRPGTASRIGVESANQIPAPFVSGILQVHIIGEQAGEENKTQLVILG